MPSNKYHFIAIGGSVMHNLAIALQQDGNFVTGSDDEITEPSKSKLEKYNLLPEKTGWYPDKIHSELSGIILGMHAKVDNPELVKAKQMGLKIFSYPEFIFEHSKHKQRIVIAGSHGKTTITSMIIHVLNYHQQDFDFLVGAQLDGFELMVRLSKSSPVIIIEGDEYPASAENNLPKFLSYHHHIGVISGIAWDHYNVYPDLNEYVKQFELFADHTPVSGSLIYNTEDEKVKKICMKERYCVSAIPYSTTSVINRNNRIYIKTDFGEYELQIFGNHNISNMNAALKVCHLLGLKDKDFYEAIKSFKGAKMRLEHLASFNNSSVYYDFAHSPSKVKATINALKNRYPTRKIYTCLELHTFSSLNKNFINQYKSTLDESDFSVVYYNPGVVHHKGLPELNELDIQNAFNKKGLLVYTDSNQLKTDLLKQNWENTNLLMMSSGTFDGMDLKALAESITGSKLQ